MIYQKRIVTLVGAGFLTACSTEAAGVGSYVASYDDGAVMVQITSRAVSTRTDSPGIPFAAAL